MAGEYLQEGVGGGEQEIILLLVLEGVHEGIVSLDPAPRSLQGHQLQNVEVRTLSDTARLEFMVDSRNLQALRSQNSIRPIPVANGHLEKEQEQHLCLL